MPLGSARASSRPAIFTPSPKSLMTPIPVLLFGVHATTAVGTDLLYAAITKTGGTLTHGLTTAHRNSPAFTRLPSNQRATQHNYSHAEPQQPVWRSRPTRRGANCLALYPELEPVPGRVRREIEETQDAD
jgi:hypothetical protein